MRGSTACPERLFWAIDPPERIARAVAEALAPVRRGAPRLSWVGPESLHLTLKFLGESAAGRAAIIAAAGEAVAHLGPVEIAVGCGGAFPPRGRPRVLWIGARGGEALLGLARALDRAMSALGHAPERRPPRPHLTVARVRRGDPSAALGALRHLGHLGSFSAREILLYRSELRRDGAFHEVVGRVELLARP